MLNIPIAGRAFAIVLAVLAFYLAAENTLISADVLSLATGISPIPANAIAMVATGLEIVFASWIRQEKTAIELYRAIRNEPVTMVSRLICLGLLLGLVYHFDVSTTAQHPKLITTSAYYFTVAVGMFVFGPEVCIFLAGWLWKTSQDTETKLLSSRSHKDAENAYQRSKREHLVSIAQEAGKQEAISKARERWGSDVS